MNTNDELSYDIDNMDLEEELLERDIIEELDKKEEQVEAEIEANKNLLTQLNLTDDLRKKCEADRTVYKFMYNDIIYKGIVIYQMSPEIYLFSVQAQGSSEKTTKKFNICNLYEVK